MWGEGLSTSFVSRAGRGFWCPDWVLEVLAFHLGGRLIREPWAAALGAEYLEKAAAGLSGCFDLRLDDLSVAEASRLRDVVLALERDVREDPNLLTAEVLNSRVYTRFGGDVEPDPICRAGEALQMVLAGTWTWRVRDQEALPAWWLYGAT